MKIAARLLSLLMLTSVVTLYIGCSKDDPAPKSEKDTQIGLLNGTWNATAVSFQETPVTSGYENFQLVIDGTEGQNSLEYTVTGRPEASAWESDGTFSFDNDSNVKEVLIRDANSATSVTITYGVTETTLHMEFEYTGEPISRTKNVAGVWEFTFEKAAN